MARGAVVSPAGRRIALGLAVLFGLAACLLNPHFFRVFALGPDTGITEIAGPLANDTQLQAQFVNPFKRVYLSFEMTRHAAGVAFWALAGLGLISFAVNWANSKPWRLLVWVAFFCLGFYQTRAIAFFAIVAAPIAAANFAEFVSARAPLELWSRSPLGTAVLGLGRLLTLTAAVALVAAAWPGWLQLQQQPRAWNLEMDRSLQQAAKKIESWHCVHTPPSVMYAPRRQQRGRLAKSASPLSRTFSAPKSEIGVYRCLV